jgi:hypothetical protein
VRQRTGATRLGQEHPRRAGADAGNGAEQLNRSGERGDLGLHLGVEPADRGTEVIDVVEQHAQQQRVVLTEPALQRQPQVGDLHPHPGLGEVGEHRWVAFAGDQRLEHRAGGLAHHIRGDRVQLDPGVLQHPLQPLDLPGALLGQLLGVSGQVPQPGHHRAGHKAAAQQPALQQLSQPGGVGDVGLAPGQVLHVPRIAQQQLIAGLGLEHVPDRLPVRAGRLHRHLADPLGDQPGAQLAQRGGEGAVLAHLLLAPGAVLRRAAHHRHHGVLVHVQPRAPIHQYVHLEALPAG